MVYTLAESEELAPDACGSGGGSQGATCKPGGASGKGGGTGMALRSVVQQLWQSVAPFANFFR